MEEGEGKKKKYTERKWAKKLNVIVSYTRVNKIISAIEPLMLWISSVDGKDSRG